MPGWYAYNGVGDPTLPSSYIRASVTPGCTNGCNICAVFLPDNTTIPTTPFSDTLLGYIADALITCTAQPPGAPVVVMKN